VRRLGGTSTSATAPTAPQNGQLWVDITIPTAPVLKVWDGSNWVVATGGTKASAVQPTTAAAGDLWVDVSGTAPVLKVYNGTTWNPVHTAPADASETVKGIVELATAAETTTGTDSTRAVHPAGLKVELDKKAPLASPALTGVPTAPTAAVGTDTTQIATTAFVKAVQAASSPVGSPTAPTAPTAGQLWIDTSLDPPSLKVWDDTPPPGAWVSAGGGTATVTSDTAPVAPKDGDLWYDSVGGELYVWYDSDDAGAVAGTWVQANPQPTPKQATASVAGVVQLADATAITAGTAGRVVDAAQMKADRMTAAGPAFSATKLTSSQIASANTWTKVQLTIVDFDTASCFDSSANYRFTANVAGYYQINATVEFNNISASYKTAIYKNGSAYQSAFYDNTTASASCGAVSVLLYLNGTTDYVELYGYTNSAASGFYGNSRLSGFLARPA